MLFGPNLLLLFLFKSRCDESALNLLLIACGSEWARPTDYSSIWNSLLFVFIFCLFKLYFFAFCKPLCIPTRKKSGITKKQINFIDNIT